jgi:hypothetical protein
MELKFQEYTRNLRSIRLAYYIESEEFPVLGFNVV